VNTQSQSAEDHRLVQLCRWLDGRLGRDGFEVRVASADASFRRYFRVTAGGRSWIAMDAPPPHEDCRPYIHVARLLVDAGVHAPVVHAQDLERGFLLLSDLGDRTYLDALDGLDAERAAPLYRDAIAALVRWQLASREGELPPYDEALLTREIRLFPEWYVARHLGIELDDAQRATLDDAFRRVIASNLAQPRVFVHRDYHSRNLMVVDPNPGVLDFQDAVHGPITYDLVSLLKDAYVEWDEERVLDWTIRYWERARAAGLPVGDDFHAFFRDFEWMGVQRHLKVLGIFARLWHRDGKQRYLADLPLVMRYLRGACARYDELAPLGRFLDEIEGQERRAAYTY
jgi:aminoglycoside/choline kinase family phosphotransferase